MSHTGNDKIIDAMRDEIEEVPMVKSSTFGENYKRSYLKSLLQDRIESFGGHQYRRGQLNMINGKSDIFSKKWQR